RAAGDSPFLTSDALTPQLVERLRALDALAKERGQSLAQLALAWVLRGGRLTSAVVGASSVTQLENNVAAVADLEFAEEELARIEELLGETGKG
ncbi:aldo/keto reductase, partial [Streptomyces sp. MBT57]|nr:aldo/keto reductase [Streptomyces sp. MBT57]